MHKLVERNRPRVVDLLNERLAFERASVRLYDTLLARLRGVDDPRLGALAGRVQEIRDQEQEHAGWLEEQVLALGGDAHTPSERSILVQTEAEGLERVVRRDPSVAHDVHALLTAELADNAGWDLLFQLAGEVGDAEAARELQKRLHEEESHLRFVRETLLQLTRNELLEPGHPPA